MECGCLTVKSLALLKKKKELWKKSFSNAPAPGFHEQWAAEWFDEF